MRDAIVQGQRDPIDAVDAIDRGMSKVDRFICPECGREVRLHAAARNGRGSPAHFEHFERNYNCSRTHIPPRAAHHG